MSELYFCLQTLPIAQRACKFYNTSVVKHLRVQVRIMRLKNMIFGRDRDWRTGGGGGEEGGAVIEQLAEAGTPTKSPGEKVGESF